MKKTLVLFAACFVFSAPLMVSADDRTGADIYKGKCAMCHAAGIANAPKLGDKDAWTSRLEAKGIDGLLESAKKGLNAMPPKGTCMDCTDPELANAIGHMIGD